MAGAALGASDCAGREIWPLEAVWPTDGAGTGAAATLFGANTGGSSSTVYSRTSRPRAQVASMSSVRKGSVTVSVDLMRNTCEPFAERSRVTVTLAMNWGQS